jgi:hypothetical protein
MVTLQHFGAGRVLLTATVVYKRQRAFVMAGSVYHGEKEGGAPHVVRMHRKPINAQRNADDPGKLTFDYEAMEP